MHTVVCRDVERRDDIPSFLQGDDIAAVTKDDLSGCQPTQNILPKHIKRILYVELHIGNAENLMQEYHGKKPCIPSFYFYFAYPMFIKQLAKIAVSSEKVQKDQGKTKELLREGFLCFRKNIFYLLIQHGVDVPDSGLFFRRRSESEPSE